MAGRERTAQGGRTGAVRTQSGSHEVELVELDLLNLGAGCRAAEDVVERSHRLDMPVTPPELSRTYSVH